jgi:hypothetical protein
MLREDPRSLAEMLEDCSTIYNAIFRARRNGKPRTTRRSISDTTRAARHANNMGSRSDVVREWFCIYTDNHANVFSPCIWDKIKTGFVGTRVGFFEQGRNRDIKPQCDESRQPSQHSLCKFCDVCVI